MSVICLIITAMTAAPLNSESESESEAFRLLDISVSRRNNI